MRPTSRPLRRGFSRCLARVRGEVLRGAEAEGCQLACSLRSPSALRCLSRARHHPGAGFVYRDAAKQEVFPLAERRGVFPATQSPSNCEDATYQLHKINLFS